jgi:hypothetical protein
MMKQFLWFFFSFLALSLSAQQTYDFSGFLMLEGGRPISYRIILEKEGEQLNGYSITGVGTSYETESELSGRWIGDELHISEFQILQTVSEEPISNFCFIHLTAKEVKKNTFEGVFEGRYLDSSSCAQGKIVFAETAKIEKKLARVQKIVEKRLENKVVHLQANDRYKTGWSSDKFKIHLWDSSQEDGDKVSLIINGEKVLSNALMRNKKTKNTYALKPGLNIVEIVAENEGKAPHNTTRIELVDKKVKHAILSQLDEGERLIMEIQY